MPISAPDAVLYRTHPQLFNSYLWLDKPPIVYQGLVNQAAAFTYPIIDPIPIDNETGTAGDVKQDMLVTFGTTAGGDDLGRTRVMGITIDTLSIPRISQGTTDGTVKLSDNVHFTIWDTFPPAPRLPFFDERFQEFYKDGIRVFVAALPPITNIGYSHIYADLVASNNKLTLTIDSSASFSPIGGTLTRLWDVEDGTITSGSTSSTAITVEFPVGRRWISLLIQDTTNNRATIRYLLVVACKHGDANYAPIVDATAGTLTQTVEGLRQSFKFGQNIDIDTYIDGAAVCYFQREFYGSTEDNLNDTTPVKFAGWYLRDSTRENATPTYLQREVTVECVDTAGMLALMPGFPQSIESNAAPTRWEEMASPNLDKFLVYLWLYHSTASNLVDFAWSGTTTTYPFFRLNSMGNSLYGQIDGRARAIGYRLLSDVKGKCKVTKDSLLFDTADRDNTNLIALVESDYTAIGWTKQRLPRSHWNRGNAVVASPSAVNAVFCIAPGIVPSWGLSANEMGENLVVSQTELNTRVGNAYAREDNDFGYFEIELINAGDIGYEPLKFVQITLGATYAAQRGLTLTTQRMMIVAVSTDYDPQFGTQRRRLTLELETFGTAAETVIPPPDPLPDITPVIDLYPPDDSAECDDEGSLNSCVGTMGLVLSDGNFARTTTWHTPSGSGGPTWTSVSMGTSGTVYTYAVDPYSSLYLGTGNEVDLWVATSVGIYKVSDVFGSISGSLQYTFVATAAFATIDASIAQQNWLVCALYSVTSGVWTTRTTDGSTWSAEAQITAFHQDAALGGLLPLVCSQTAAGTAWTGAYTSTGSAGDTPPFSDGFASVYKTVNHGASWTIVTSPTGFDFVTFAYGGMHIPQQSNTPFYISGRDRTVTSYDNEFLYRDNGNGTFTDITPSTGGVPYHGFSPRSLSSCPINPQRLVLAGQRDNTASGNLRATFVSQDQGQSWTAIVASNSPYTFAAIAGDNQNILYLAGASGAVGYSANFGTVIDSRIGNLSTSATVRGMVGG